MFLRVLDTQINLLLSSPSCFIILNSLPNDNNRRPVNDVILRSARIDDDVITEFNSDGSEGASIIQTIISGSYKSAFNKLYNSNNFIIISRYRST